MESSTIRPFLGDKIEGMITEVHKIVCVNQISPEQYLRAVLDLLHTGMLVTRTKEHNLHDSDGVLIMNVKLYE